MSASARAQQRAVEVAITCPACRDNAHTQQQVYQFALAYLCDEHADVWVDADQRSHRTSKCPHSPRKCTLDRAQCVQT